ncbi:transcriptional regulator LacI family [Candidatus Colimorpha enterica]|uniref:Transcriptional regulator LacI family n=1 Tax=Candidatus Colimorpha enterica TaxID=3083063 RepID=R6TTC9_9BACT|nr:transcriptional regulator LacI family [Candidatus Colimorpha enterica]
MVKLLENRLRAFGYDLIIMNTSENPDQELQCVTSALSKNVDGVIICPSMHNCDALDLMERHGVPFVLMGRYFRDRSYESVVADDFRSGYLLTDHMIGLGHTKIAYIGASTHVSSSAERLEGYRAALSAHGIVPDDRLVRICMTPEDITAAAVEIAEHRLDCTSVFGFCDMFCWHIASILAGHGIRIPDGISMGGVDDLLSHIIFPFDLTSVDCPKEQMADCVIKSLFSRIGGDGAKSIRHIIEPTLVVRTSVKSLPGQLHGSLL